MTLSITITKPVTDLRKKLFSVLENLNNEPEEVIAITQKGKPKGVLMSFDLFESLVETLDILSDSELVEEIKQAKKSKEYVSLETINQSLFLSDKKKKYGIQSSVRKKGQKRSRQD